MQNSEAAKLKAARRVVAAEIRSYDLLSRRSKIRRVEPKSRLSSSYENEHRETQYGPQQGYVCSHQISLCSPCDKCARSQQDCVEYQVALATKLKALLSQLDKA